MIASIYKNPTFAWFHKVLSYGYDNNMWQLVSLKSSNNVSQIHIVLLQIHRDLVQIRITVTLTDEPHPINGTTFLVFCLDHYFTNPNIVNVINGGMKIIKLNSFPKIITWKLNFFFVLWTLIDRNFYQWSPNNRNSWWENKRISTIINPVVYVLFPIAFYTQLYNCVTVKPSSYSV